MRKLLICSLLALVPSTGVRMVCLDPLPGTTASQPGDAQAACDEFCLRRNAPGDKKATGSNVGCLLLADGELLLMVSGIAVLPAVPTIEFDSPAPPVEDEDRNLYLPPALAQHSPPPKS
jgi:hypothetical protein